MNLPLLYERWLEKLLRGESEPPVSLLKFQRMGINRKIDFLSGLGFSEHFAESRKELILESDEFDRAIYYYADDSEETGSTKALKALSQVRNSVMTEAANALESVLDNMPPIRRRH